MKWHYCCCLFFFWNLFVLIFDCQLNLVRCLLPRACTFLILLQNANLLLSNLHIYTKFKVRFFLFIIWSRSLCKLCESSFFSLLFFCVVLSCFVSLCYWRSKNVWQFSIILSGYFFFFSKWPRLYNVWLNILISMESILLSYLSM